MPDDNSPPDAPVPRPRRRRAAAPRHHGAAARPRARLPLGHRAELRHHRALHDRGGLRGRRRHRRAATWTSSRDELGDLLLQVVYHARMAEEARRLRLRRRGARRSPTRWSAATRMSSAPTAATRPPSSRPATGRRSRPPSAPAAPRSASALDGVARGPAGADPRGQAAEPRRPRRLRLARRRRGARQDRRGDRASSSRPATATPTASPRNTAT